MPFTTRGMTRLLDAYFRRQTTRPTYFYMALVVAENGSPPVDVSPSHDTKTFGELVQITPGNGYTNGGYQLTPNATDFDALTEDDVNAITELSLKNISWSASGGSIPASGNSARYCVLLASESSSPEAISAREVIWYASLSRDRSAVSGQLLQLTSLDIRLKGGSMVRSSTQYTITMTTVATATQALSPSVDTTKAYIINQGFRYTGSTPAITSMIPRLELTNSTTVTAYRGSAEGTVEVTFRVIDPF